MFNSFVMTLKEDVKPRLIVLKETYKFSEQDIRVHGKWTALNEGYRDLEKASEMGFNIEWEDRAIQSIVNSIVFQQRIYCCITREGLRKVLTEDKNWITLDPVGLGNTEVKKGNTKVKKGNKKKTKYQFLLQALQKKGIVELFDDSTKTHVYKVIHPYLLQMIKGDSEETQRAQVMDFIGIEREKEKTDRTTDGLTDRTTDGLTDIDREIVRKEERQPEIAANAPLKETNTGSNNVKIPLEALLAKNLDDWSDKATITTLAEMAVEQCDDFDGGAHDIRVFEKYLLGLKGKTSEKELTPKQTPWFKDLSTTFGFAAQRHYNLLKYQNIETSEPTKIQSNSLKIAAESEDFVHSNTLSVLKMSGNNEHLRVLKRKLEKATTEERKAQLAMEIKFWEGV